MINAYVPNRTVSTDLFEKRLKDADLSPMVTKCKTINEREQRATQMENKVDYQTYMDKMLQRTREKWENQQVPVMKDAAIQTK